MNFLAHPVSNSQSMRGQVKNDEFEQELRSESDRDGETGTSQPWFRSLSQEPL